MDEELPFILLNSLEANDAQRIAKHVGYIEEHAELVAAMLLAEDATVIDEAARRVIEICQPYACNGQRYQRERLFRIVERRVRSVQC